MPRLRALRKQEDIDKVPLDQPVMIDMAEEQPGFEVEPNGHDKVTPEPQPQPQPEPEPEEDEARTALSKRVAELEAAEKTRATEHARQIAEWQQRAQSAEQQRTTARQEAQQSREAALQAHADAIANSITAQQELLESAERDLEAAFTAQDAKGQANATKRITMASSYLAQLEASKTQFESQREALKAEPEPQPQPQPAPVDPIDQMPRLSMRQKEWLKGHRELLADERKNRKLGVAHDDALEAGHAQDSPGYFQFLEERMGYRQPDPEPEPEPEPEPQSTPARRSIVSAPVSRSAPSLSTGRRESETRMTLTAEQREAARLSGISEVDYAKQVRRLDEAKRRGEYPMVNQK